MENINDFVDNASVGNNYNWTSLNIDLNFNKSEIDLDSIIKREKQFGDTHNEVLFIHEYVHFVQNFYCNWGGLVFCEFVLSLEKLGASKAVDDFKLSMPLKIEHIADANLWNDGVDYYNKFQLLIGSKKEEIILENACKSDKISIKKIAEEELIINNGRISYTINCKTIREHMADLSSMLFMNYSDTQIHERFSNSSAFCSSPKTLDKQPTYWMLLEYFYSNELKNIAEGLVLICHAALSTASPLRMIIRFFKFSINFKGGKDLVELVHRFLTKPVEIIAYSFSFNATLQSLVNQLKLCSSHADHDFYRFNIEIFNTLMMNISNHFSAKLFFRNPANLRNKDAWVQMIHHTGTPIIRYKDKTPVISTFSNKLVESLTYFLGVAKVLENLKGSSMHCCPFHTDFDICKALYKNNENCFHDPLLVKNPFINGKECLFHNAIELMGLTDRIS